MPRFRDLAELEAEQARVLQRAIGEAVDAGKPAVVHARVVKAEPGDLRGIPALARGVGGVIPGTHPEGEALRRSGEGGGT